MKMILWVAPTLVTISLLNAGPQEDPDQPPSLEVLKRLAGDWIKVEDKDHCPAEVISSFRTTAGGSAVVETLFPGTGHEMVTVYHQDGEKLVLTHYCVAGNQPRMQASAASTTQKLIFECQGGTNMESENDAHMHRGVIHLVGEDQLKVEWHRFTNGKSDYTARFNLIRTETR